MKLYKISINILLLKFQRFQKVELITLTCEWFVYILKYVEFSYTSKVKLYYTGSCEVIKNKNDQFSVASK